MPRTAASLAHGFLLSPGTALLWGRNGTCSWLTKTELDSAAVQSCSTTPLLNLKRCFMLVVYSLMRVGVFLHQDWVVIQSKGQCWSSRDWAWVMTQCFCQDGKWKYWWHIGKRKIDTFFPEKWQGMGWGVIALLLTFTKVSFLRTNWSWTHCLLQDRNSKWSPKSAAIASSKAKETKLERNLEAKWALHHSCD